MPTSLSNVLQSTRAFTAWEPEADYCTEFGWGLNLLNSSFQGAVTNIGTDKPRVSAILGQKLFLNMTFFPQSLKAAKQNPPAPIPRKAGKRGNASFIRKKRLYFPFFPSSPEEKEGRKRKENPLHTKSVFSTLLFLSLPLIFLSQKREQKKGGKKERERSETNQLA